MTFRRRRRINWLSVISLLIGVIGIASLIAPRLSLPKQWTQQLSFMPKPTPTATPVIDDGASTLSKANSLFADGKLDEAAEQYALAIATIERAQADFLFVADKLETAGNATEAAARRTDAQNAVLRAATAYTHWCKILALRNKAADAIIRCNRSIEINNRSAEAYAFLALAYDRNNEFDKAISAAQRAIDLDPSLAEGYAFLAEAYADKSPFEKRNLETAQKAVATNGRSAFAHRVLGWVYETEGKYRDAALSYQTATELMPTLSYFYLDLCRAHKSRGLLDDAVTACVKATELDPQNPEVFDRLGQIYYDKMDSQKALVQFEKAVAIDPGYAVGYGHLGWVYYFRMRAWDKAAAAFEKAIELGTNKLSAGLIAEFYTELGWTYYYLSRCTEARSAFDRSLGLLARNTGPGAATIVQQAQEGLKMCEGRK
jgi:tetratricopeptide (TPR) repeat protein